MLPPWRHRRQPLDSDGKGDCARKSARHSSCSLSFEAQLGYWFCLIQCTWLAGAYVALQEHCCVAGRIVCNVIPGGLPGRCGGVTTGVKSTAAKAAVSLLLEVVTRHQVALKELRDPLGDVVRAVPCCQSRRIPSCLPDRRLAPTARQQPLHDDSSLPCSMAFVSGVLPSEFRAAKFTPCCSARNMHVSRSPPDAAQWAAEQPLALSERIVREAASTLPRSPVDLAGEPLEKIPLPSPRAPVNDAVAVVRHGAYVCPVLHQPFGRRRMATRSATLPRAILT